MSGTQFHILLYGPPGEGNSHCRTASAIPTSLEAAADRLTQQIPDLLFEPDGSFAWNAGTDQLAGIIYDASGLIQYVEIQGCCRGLHLRRLVQALAGQMKINAFRLMTLPNRQWKEFQEFEDSLSGENAN